MNIEEKDYKKLVKSIIEKKRNSNYHKHRKEDVDKFLLDIIDVSKKHNMTIAHEDCQGGFLVENWDESNLSWLFSATDKR